MWIVVRARSLGISFWMCSWEHLKACTTLWQENGLFCMYQSARSIILHVCPLKCPMPPLAIQGFF